MNQSVRWFLSALSAALNQKELPAIVSELDLLQVTRLARFVHFENVLYYVKQDLGLPIGEQESDLFIRNVMLDAEQSMALSELLCRLGRAGIEVIPLKGSRLKSLYPTTDMRYMGDIDLLYRGNEDTALSVMTDLGYQPKSLKHGEVHHVFEREDITVEMHHRLLHDSAPLDGPLASLWERAVPSQESPGVFDLCPEDFYLHMISHAVMHMLEGGIGIRTFIDFGLYLRSHPYLADNQRIREALVREGLDTFEARVRHLSSILLDGERPSCEDERILDGLLQSGIFGTGIGFAARTMTRIGKGEEKPSRIKYIFSRIFPSVSDLARLYPTLRGGFLSSVLYPFYWVRRLFAILFHKDRRKRIGKSYLTASAVDEGELAAVRFEQQYFGIGKISVNSEEKKDEA